MFEPVQIIGLGTIGVSLIVAGATKFGRWIERQTQAAEFRAQKRRWFEEVAPTIDWTVRDWPPVGTASATFFGTDIVAYDPEADAREHIAKLHRETQEYIQRIRA
jgi:hypothetical protein